MTQTEKQVRSASEALVATLKENLTALKTVKGEGLKTAILNNCNDAITHFEKELKVKTAKKKSKVIGDGPKED